MRLHCTRESQGAANNATGVIAPFVAKTAAETNAAQLHSSQGAVNNATGVIAPFVVKTAAEANAAPLHSGIPRRGKQRHGSHRAFRRQDRS